jgi:hypothetical protein
MLGNNYNINASNMLMYLARQPANEIDLATRISKKYSWQKHLFCITHNSNSGLNARQIQEICNSKLFS